MATDSTELTFVRCPACGSLVPAVSTRCKMCGASLDFEQAEGAGRGDAKRSSGSGRVRQNTESALSSLREQDASGHESAGTNGSDPVVSTYVMGEEGSEVTGGSEAGLEDPLSAYIEEVEVEDAAKEESYQEPQVLESGSKATSKSKSTAIVEDFDDLDDLPIDEEDDLLDFVDKSNAEKSSQKEDAADEVDFEKFLEEIAEEETQGAGEEEKDVPEAAFVAGHKQKKAGGQTGQQSGKTMEFDSSKDLLPEEDLEEKQEEEVKEQKAKKSSKASRKSGKKAAKKKGSSSAAAKAPEVSAEAPGRLFGWLVSYDDEQGQSIELREGKFFVCQSQIKPGDLVLDDESISSPHALVRINADAGIVVQDLMSETGTFVKSQGEEEYVAETEAIQLENGDWLKLGDLEFLLALVPYVGIK